MDNNQIKPFNVHSEAHNIGIRWEKWINRFDIFLTASNISEDKRKAAMLLHLVGEEVYDLYASLPRTDPTSEVRKYDTIKNKLTDHFKPKVNTSFEIFNFRKAKQENESIDQFYTRLIKLSANCKFVNRDEEIKAQIISNTRSTSLRRFGLREEPKLEVLLEQGRLLETTKLQLDVIEHDNSETSHTNRVDFKKFNKKQGDYSKHKNFSYVPNKTQQCKNCGNMWHQKGRQTCPAVNVTCLKCGKRGHFSKVCLSKNNQTKENKPRANFTKQSEETVKTFSSDSDNSFKLTTNSLVKTPKTSLTLNDNYMRFIIDTGSSVNIISSSCLKHMIHKPSVTCVNTKIYPYNSNEALPIAGSFTGVFKYKHQVTTDEVFILEGEAEPLLSFKTASALNIVHITQVLDTLPTNVNIEWVKKNIPSLTDGIGNLTNFEVHLHINKEIQPVAQKHRRIPFHLRARVEAELKRLEDEDIIEKANGATPWVSPIVIVPKPHNPEVIRMCVDMRVPNKAIKRERHVTPTIDDIILQLNGAILFSKIDLKDGYHQLTLDKESRVITTFSTHCGLYRYKRLNFGVNAAAELFQDTIRQVLANIPGVLNVVDDILIFGKSKQEHDEALLAVLKRLSERNLTVNENKCAFSQNEVTFFGFVFSKEGIKPDPKKVEVFKKLEPPTNATEVRSLLGMLNYVGKFLPNLASATKPLRELILKNAEWNWNQIHQDAFLYLKKILSNANNLAYFDINKKTHVHVDAGPQGLAAIISQEDKNKIDIVAYGSRTLTSVEERYSQIEKEMLAINWALQHFHIYLSGMNFILHTDHKPIVNILRNPRAAASPRIERLILKIQQYSYVVVHQKGATNPSDYFSRHPLQIDQKQDHKIENFVNFIIQNSIPNAMSVDEVRAETVTDRTLTELLEAIQENRPSLWNNPNLKSFKLIKNELTAKDNIILRGSKLILPSKLQQRAVDLAHKGHQGIVKTKQLLRTKLWFPNIDKMVEDTIKNCLACQSVTQTHNRDPIMLGKTATEPFERAAIDFVGPFPNNKYILVLVDEYTKYPIVEVVNSTNFENIQKVLQKIFRMFGIIKEIKSDNGPPFNSRDFEQFAEKYNFKHQKVTPYWPEANGQAERFVETLSKSLRCSNLEDNNFTAQLNVFLMNYVSTPHPATKQSPYELLFNRKMNNFLPSFDSPEEDKENNQAAISNNDAKLKNKQYADKRRHTRTHTLNVGDLVLSKQNKTNKLTTAFDPSPFVIIKVRGTKIFAKRGKEVKIRNASFFKRISEHCKLSGKARSPSTHSEDDVLQYDRAPVTEPAEEDLMPNNAFDAPAPRPRRDRKTPAHLEDYVTYKV